MAPPGVDLMAGASPRPGVRPGRRCWAWAAWWPRRSPTSPSRLAPLTAAEAAALPGELAGRALLDGFRGGPVARPRRARARCWPPSATCWPAAPALDEVEINPLRVTGDGLIALDAVTSPDRAKEADDA